MRLDQARLDVELVKEEAPQALREAVRSTRSEMVLYRARQIQPHRGRR